MTNMDEYPSDDYLRQLVYGGESAPQVEPSSGAVRQVLRLGGVETIPGDGAALRVDETGIPFLRGVLAFTSRHYS